MMLLAGLGNPGKEYQDTLHNVGFSLLEALPTQASWKNQKQALVQDIVIEGKKILLALPQTYMNLSGQSLVQLMHFYKIAVTDLAVVCDDIQLPLGTLRIRPKGSHGGHNGLRNIIECLGTDAFTRIRVGVGPAPAGNQWKNYVLKKMSSGEKTAIHQIQQFFPDLIACAVREGWEKTASRYNGAKV